MTRQALVAIEAGRQAPSTPLALQLAHALGTTVEALFSLEGLPVSLVARPGPADRLSVGERVVLGQVAAQWVAHRAPWDGTSSADAVVDSASSKAGLCVRPFDAPSNYAGNAFVAGCAPVLGALRDRVSRRFTDAAVHWLLSSSGRALDALAANLVHVAGIHLSAGADRTEGEGASTEATHAAEVRRRFPKRRMLLIRLIGWVQGIVVGPGNPLGIRSVSDLLRPGLRIARRQPDAGASQLLSSLLSAQGLSSGDLSGPVADSHTDVARFVLSGAADAGIAVEGVARATGLGFVPLQEEGFDLVVPAESAEVAPVSTVLGALDDARFRAELGHFPGYDPSQTGHARTLDAAEGARHARR